MTPRPSEERAISTTLALREVEVTGRPARFIEGRAVPYDTFADVGWFREQHAAGSFKKSTAGGTGRKLPLLLFHDNRSFPVGHADSWGHDDGLTGVWKLNGSPEADRAADAAASGDLVGLSIGFMPVRSDWEYVEEWNPELGPEYKDKVTRLESRLLEVSLTPTPAFPDAEVTSVRSAFDVEVRAAMARERTVAEADAWREEVDRLRLSP